MSNGITVEALLREMEEAYQEVRRLLEGLDYSLDWKARPDDEADWSARDVVTHLLGGPGVDLATIVRRALAEETPSFQVRPGDPYRSPERRQMRMPQLREALDSLYREVQGLVRSAGPGQLGRRVRLEMPGMAREFTVAELVYYAFARDWRESAERLRAIRGQLGVDDL